MMTDRTDAKGRKYQKGTLYVMYVPKTDKDIFNRRYLANLINNKPGQRHNCQLWGHANYSFQASPKSTTTRLSEKNAPTVQRDAPIMEATTPHPTFDAEENPHNKPKPSCPKKPFTWGQQNNEQLRQRPQRQPQQQVTTMMKNMRLWWQ